MVKVITYGTYDMLHYGHIRLLERAKALGDYLIVGVTSDDYDKTRGKINNQQSLTERVESIRATGLADQIVVEEYEGQKIDDIRKYNIDISVLQRPTGKRKLRRSSQRPGRRRGERAVRAFPWAAKRTAPRFRHPESVLPFSGNHDKMAQTEGYT